MRRMLPFACLPFLVLATNAFGQVRVTAYLEKEHYLQGEPVVVIVEALNTGSEPVVEGMKCLDDIKLTITDVKRRETPRLWGCSSGDGFGCGFSSHPPPLAPGHATSSRLLLKGYDLSSGSYRLTVSGQIRFEWVPRAGPVPGADFVQPLALEVRPATNDQLRTALAPLIADAEGADVMRQAHARAAIIESAPPFLADLISRFAPPYDAGAAADALRRIGTPESRRLLVDLYRRTAAAEQPSVAAALALTGDAGLMEFLSGILLDPVANSSSRRYAALGLGLMGGDRVVQVLEGALAADASPRTEIVTALGHTRSRLAVPVLIGLFGNNDAESNVCTSLKVLTHRQWCAGGGYDPAAQRRRWLRSWAENGSTTPIYGLDACAALEEADRLEDAERAADALKQPVASDPFLTARPSGRAPKITSVLPAITSPGSSLRVFGDSLGVENSSAQKVLFVRGSDTHIVKGSGGGRSLKDGVEGPQHVYIQVPATLEPGRWQLVIDANGRRTPAVTIDLVAPRPVEWRPFSGPRPHPSQWIQLDTKIPPQEDDDLELTDSRGVDWIFANTAGFHGFTLTFPDDVAEGEVSIRVRRKRGGTYSYSTSLKFSVTPGPSPLTASALAFMKPVAAGQWTDLTPDTSDEFEIDRADRIEIEFKQGDRVFTSEVTARRIQVPIGLKPGMATARSRTLD